MRSSILFTTLALTTSSLAHMQMSWPYPIRSSFDPQNNYTDIDYSMTSPLNSDGSNFPCKGYQNDATKHTTATYTAGDVYNMTLAGSATHGGGSCQLSLSYDDASTFKVIHSMIGGCPLVTTYDFTVPTYAPSGTALLAWSWVNLEGNREYYMNCAQVDVIGGEDASADEFDALPEIFVANLGGINNCTTVEGQQVVYPDPGPEVEYGSGESASSPPSTDLCG
ncbi:MAG: hypothetical protein M1819_003743 [Sarea resinae]|nr:MAG: hypothetical protein M1819_003743 [Sarea resinae]